MVQLARNPVMDPRLKCLSMLDNEEITGRVIAQNGITVSGRQLPVEQRQPAGKSRQPQAKASYMSLQLDVAQGQKLQPSQILQLQRKFAKVPVQGDAVERKSPAQPNSKMKQFEMQSAQKIGPFKPVAIRMRNNEPSKTAQRHQSSLLPAIANRPSGQTLVLDVSEDKPAYHRRFRSPKPPVVRSKHDATAK
mgnify:CR=1 FL=1|jgi:hypothetical protein